MELTMTNNFGFCELDENEIMMVDGGKVSVAGIVCGIFTIAAGICTIGGAIALCVVPEPTVTKVAAAWGIAAGVCTIGAGISGIAWACGY